MTTPDIAQTEPEALAWLVTWRGGEHTYVQAYASELTAVDKARIMGGTCTPLYPADEIERTARNRDMWKGQCERQAERLQRLHEVMRFTLRAADTYGASVELFDVVNEKLRAAMDAGPAPSLTVGDAPAAKLTVHDDEVRFGVYRVTAELYAPGLPPGRYDVFLEPEPAAQAEPAAWQPIETAPMDGTAILAFWKPVSGSPASHCYGITEFVEGRWRNPEEDDDYYIAPTHWMPLPSAPGSNPPAQGIAPSPANNTTPAPGG